MGQSLNSMTQSNGELLHGFVVSANVDAIKSLCSQGVNVNLECIDMAGKTPLIVACMDSGLFNVAKILIQLGANVNAYRPGRHAGTPLHHAAKRRLEQTVLLLLSSGANALVRNDDCHTALDVARVKGHTKVVRAIENHISLFSGWLREFHGPGFLEAVAPQLLSRKIWAAVIPCGSSNPMKPLKLELAIYTSMQDAQPRTVIALWKAKIEDPKFHHSDPVLILFDNCTKIRYKFASFNEGDKQQLRRLYDACTGIPQVMPPTRNDTQTAMPGSIQQTSAEALDLAMAISASIQSAMEESPPLLNTHQNSETINLNSWGDSVHGESHNGWGPAVSSSHSEASSSGCMDNSEKENYNGWDLPNSRPISNQGCLETQSNTPVVQTGNLAVASVSSVPSAPPIPDEILDEGPIHYPSIDFSPVESSVPPVEHGKDGNGSSSCIICWEAPIEGACIPCGHMAGCMACLSEIKDKKGDCPVCRAKINQVIRLYAV